MNTVAFIFARGGSKGLPRKNVLPFAGKPLIAWTIIQAKSIPTFRRVIVSTDSEEIATVALEYGAEVPFMRPLGLAQDNSPEWLAWQHALSYLIACEGGSPDAVAILPVTSPLRTQDDIERCLQEFETNEADVVLTASPAKRNPYFNMVTCDENGTATLAIQPERLLYRRQDAPDLFDIATIAYILRPSFLMSRSNMFEGLVKAVIVPSERAIDIDSPSDFAYAELLFSASRCA